MISPGAESAFRRATQRGDAASATNLGMLLEQRGDLAGAEAAYRRADERGDGNAAFNLGGLLAERNDLAGAEAAFKRADARGDAAGAFNLAVLLEDRDDLAGAEAAYRRARDRGARRAVADGRGRFGQSPGTPIGDRIVRPSPSARDRARRSPSRPPPVTQAARATGAQSRSASSRRSVSRPRWCRPWIEDSVRPIRSAISPGERPTRCRSMTTLRCSSGSASSATSRPQRHSRLDSSVWRVGAKTSSLRDRASLPQMIDRDVPSHPQDPGGERHRPRLVLLDGRDQLHEHLLRAVLGLVLLANNAQDVAVDVVLVADVKEANRLHVTRLCGRYSAVDCFVPVVVLERRAGAKSCVHS